MLSAIGNAISGAVGNVETAANLKRCEAIVKQHTGKDIEITAVDIPDTWQEFIRITGVNSLCTEDTWSFLEKSTYNQRKLDLWEKKNIKKIVLKVDERPDEDMKDWCYATVEYGESNNSMIITFLPYAKSWSSSNVWWDSGSKCWWILSDCIVFGLQLYQLPGKCFYKSDWLDGFQDVDPDSLLPTGTKKFSRWFQFRHWCIFWYERDMWGYNYQWTENPPKNPDGSLFSLDNILKCPSMPNIKMPSIKLPSLPNVNMPSLPSVSMPSLSMPSLSMPSLSAPSLSMPSLGSLPSMPSKKKRPKGKYDAHGIIEMEGLKVKASGKKLTLSNANITHFWQNASGGVDDERKEKQKLVLEAINDEQAESWKLSLIEGGATEGEASGCCTVA